MASSPLLFFPAPCKLSFPYGSSSTNPKPFPLIATPENFDYYIHRPKSSFFTEYTWLMDSVHSRINSYIGLALEQRSELDLPMPDPFSVEIGWKNSPETAAASYRRNSTVLIVNFPNLVMPHLDQQTRAKMGIIVKYITTLQEMTGLSFNPAFLSSDEGPDLLFSQAELLGYAAKNYILESEKKQYISTKQKLISQTKYIKDLFLEITYSIVNTFDTVDTFDIFCHEIDHLSFYKSELWKGYMELSDTIYFLSSDLNDKHVNEWYFRTLENQIATEMWMVPLLETRAWYFNFLKMDQIKTKSVDFAVPKVFRKVSPYGEKAHFFPALAELHYRKGDFNKKTFDDLLAIHTESIILSLEVLAYFNQKGHTPHSFIDKLFGCTTVVSKYVRQFAEVLCETYRDDPSRFKIADHAATLDEYLEVCLGNKPILT